MHTHTGFYLRASKGTEASTFAVHNYGHAPDRSGLRQTVLSYCLYRCVYERERERESVCVCMCVCAANCPLLLPLPVCVCVREKGRARESSIQYIFICQLLQYTVYVYMSTFDFFFFRQLPTIPALQPDIYVYIYICMYLSIF